MADTEYDNSPEAYEKYFANQRVIARWVDQTSKEQPLNPFTPATPAVANEAYQKHLPTQDNYTSAAYQKYLDTQQRVARWADYTMQEQLLNPFTPATPPAGFVRPLDDDHDSSPHSSSRHKSRCKNRAQGQDVDFDDGRSSAPTYIDIYHRSPSLSAHSSHPPMSLAPPRSDDQHSIASTVHFSQYSVPQPTQYQPSRPSSNSSSVVCLASTSTTHLPQTTQNYPSELLPHQDSYTVPGYSYPYGDSVVLMPGPGAFPPVVVPPWAQPFDMAPVPQMPYNAYPSSKQPPLLKRLFQGLTGGDKSRAVEKSRAPRRTRRDSY